LELLVGEKKMEWKRDTEYENVAHFARLILDDDGDNWYKCSVKWDGCIHFYRAYNNPFNHDVKKIDTDYIHICNLDEYIEILTKLRETAKEYFANHGREWPPF